MIDAAAPAASEMSVALEALWADSQLNPRQIAYNEVAAFRKRGPLDVPALRRAFNALVSRHEVWHSVMGMRGGEPVLIAQPPQHFALELIDLSGLAAEAAERQTVRLVAELARAPYDITRGPLLRPQLLRLADGEHRLYVAMHHMMFDGISLYRTLLPELVAFYDAFHDGREVTLEPVSATYSDYARWEREWITSRRAQRRLDYWQQRLTPVPTPILPTDQPRPETAQRRGGCLPVYLPSATAAQLQVLGRPATATLFQVFGAVWAATLHRFSGETDIAFGAPADLRQRSEFTSIVGYCLSQVVIRADLSDDPTFGDLVSRIRNEVLDGLDHLVPFERIVRNLPDSAAAGANPVYQTMLTLEPTVASPDESWSLHLMDSRLSDAVGGSRVDLELQLDQHPDGSIDGRLVYDRDLFDRATVERLLGAWRQIIEFVTTDPGLRLSELQLGDSLDEGRAAEVNATAAERPARSIAERFSDIAERQPLAAAVSAGDRLVTYGDLQQRAVTGAAQLRDLGVGPGDVVAVCLEPSPGLVAAVLATLNAGAATLLLDPSDSPERMRAQMSGAGCSGLIQSADAESSIGGLPALAWTSAPSGESLSPMSVAVAPDSLCCVESHPDQAGGLTRLAHDTVDQLATSMITRLGLGPGQTVLVLPGTLYESPCTELWPTLLAGARLVFATPDVATDGGELSKLIRREGVSLLHAAPSRWAALIDTGLRPARGLGVLVGEPISRELADALVDGYRVVWSGYRTASGAGFSTLGRVSATGPVTVGRPVANHRVHVLDNHGHPVPTGFVGELVVSGPLAQAGPTTDEMLVPEPGAPSRALRTGRRARWLHDGRLIVL